MLLVAADGAVLAAADGAAEVGLVAAEVFLLLEQALRARAAVMTTMPAA
jgi:hypothetical protein